MKEKKISLELEKYSIKIVPVIVDFFFSEKAFELVKDEKFH